MGEHNESRGVVRWVRWWVGVLSVGVGVVVFGCSDEFAGMWDYDEEAPFHSAKAEGVLLIEGSCVYVVDDYSWLIPGTPSEELPEPVRIFVSLPRGLTKYDSDNKSVWVNDKGPIVSGDRIEMVGGGVALNLPDVCSTDVDRAFNVKSMEFKRCKLWFPSDHLSQSGCNPAVSDPLAGMRDYQEGGPGYPIEGILLIEGRCVYILDDYSRYFDDGIFEVSPDSVRIFLVLPRDKTRYDPDTKSIWVHDHGPMKSGDLVKLTGVRGSLSRSSYLSLPEMCSAGVDSLLWADYVQPKLCDQNLPVDHTSQVGCKPVIAE